MNQEKFRNILVIRTDRMGDVILSTPVLSALRNSFPNAKITMMLRPYTEEIVSGHPDADELLLFDEAKDIRNFADRLKWVKKIREMQFDAVLVLYPTFTIAMLVFWARIPVRVGTGYRAYSFLFNRRVYHHRKTAERHELEYNLDLAQKLGAELPDIEFKFHIPDDSRQKVATLLETHGISGDDGFVVIHPGSGGSAMDWPADKFAALADRIVQETELKIILNGGPGEDAIVQTGQLPNDNPANDNICRTIES